MGFACRCLFHLTFSLRKTRRTGQVGGRAWTALAAFTTPSNGGGWIMFGN